MSRVLVVGSGASGVHFAQTALERGHRVTMLDVGHERPEPVAPDAPFEALRTALSDPVGYFLGPQADSVVYPSRAAKYYGFPPSKSYVFAGTPGFRSVPRGFDPVSSFARGGLAEAWTGGVYPLNDAELAAFPFDAAALAPHYDTVAERIGISAERDDLERFSAWSERYQPSIEADPHTAHLLRRYSRARASLQSRGFYLGRSRVAALSRDHAGRRACDRLGRCLWGCPRESLYTPSFTLRQLLEHAAFEYVPGVLVERFDYDTSGEVGRMIARSATAGTVRGFSADLFVLAAGTLGSSKIVLDSIRHATGETVRLSGLMDNRQIMMPFLTTARLGEPADTRAYQFHQLALGIAGEEPAGYVHGQITTLKAASVHPIAQSLPVDLRSALTLFRGSHAALGVANIWLHDERRPENWLSVRPRPDAAGTDLVINSEAPAGESARVGRALVTVRRALRALGCIVPPGMTRILPRGSSIHYAGTIPMAAGGELTADQLGRSRDFPNLCLADGATFPFLPAKNLTFTLMANAVRMAEALL